MRRQFLRDVGFGLITLFILLGVIYSASAQPITTISITGKVTDPYWGTVNLHVNGRGDHELIKGLGVGFHVEKTAELRFEVTGSVSGTLITLEGTVIQAPLNFNFLLGLPIIIYADASSGYIYQNFAMFMEFEGTGTVIINN